MRVRGRNRERVREGKRKRKREERVKDRDREMHRNVWIESSTEMEQTNDRQMLHPCPISCSHDHDILKYLIFTAVTTTDTSLVILYVSV